AGLLGHREDGSAVRHNARARAAEPGIPQNRPPQPMPEAPVPFDPADAAFLDDPYPTFAALRAVAPVHEHPLLGMPVAVSHAACADVLRARSLGRIWADA